MKTDETIPPGSCLGVLGGGQLGRMFAQAAQAMGYSVQGLAQEPGCPLAQVCPSMVVADWADQQSLRAFARQVDVVTLEFENVPVAAVQEIERLVPVRPGGHVLNVTQNRLREKSFLAGKGLPVAPFLPLRSADDLSLAAGTTGFPAVLKTAGSGYDGKGQKVVRSEAELAEAFKRLSGNEAVLEQFIEFDRELSVIGARSTGKQFAAYGPIENIHKDHILDISLVPARGVYPSVARTAVDLTRTLMEALDAVGLLCVEFFLTGAGDLLVNELAPRPHNSGHYTIEAAETSQFQQQVRAVTGLPLGSPANYKPAAMVNILGDLWHNGEPDWAKALSVPGVQLHLYGKDRPARGRKMGHLTAVADDVDSALALALAARSSLSRRPEVGP